MSIKITIYDGATPMLDKIAEAHYGQALDALDYAGIKLREATRREFRSSKTKIRQFYDKNGNFGITKAKTARYGLGKRISHKNKTNSDKTANMENLITSNLMVNSLTMVVAGRHKRMTPKKRRDGKVVGSFSPIAVNKGSYGILQKLNDGETDGEFYKTVKRTKQQHKIFDKMKFSKQNFIEKGRLSAMPDVHNIMTTKYAQLLQKQMDRINVNSKVVKSA